MGLKNIIDSMSKHIVGYFMWHREYLGFHLCAAAIYYSYKYFFVDADGRRMLKPPQSKSKKRKQSQKEKSLKETPAVFLDTSLVPSVVESETASSISEGESTIQSEQRDLHEQIPESTVEECQRFVAVGSIETANDMLRHYIDWHKEHQEIAKQLGISPVSSDDVDADYWIAACKIAIHSKKESYNGTLPQVISLYSHNGEDIRDLDGKRIFHIMPSKMDKELVSLSTYALASALYLDRRLARDSIERITVCMDVRAGEGLPNLHAAKLVSFMKETSQLLLALFPERLNKCLVYPIPNSFYWVWKMVRTVLEPETRQKVCPLNGPCKIEAPPPRDHMIEHMSEETADLLEAERVRCFKTTTTTESTRSTAKSITM